MPSSPRTEAQRAASGRNGARSTGPRTPEGRVRSSANRTTHGLNSVRLLLATEDVEEYRQHLTEWAQSLGPATAAEHQIVQLVADLMWRLKRVERIDQRRALAILGDLVEQTPESAARARAQDLLVGLDTVARMVASSPLPVPTSKTAGFLAGVRGVENLVEQLRAALDPTMWPDGMVSVFRAAVEQLAMDTVMETEVAETFTAVGTTAAALATSVRDLLPALDACRSWLRWVEASWLARCARSAAGTRRRPGPPARVAARYQPAPRGPRRLRRRGQRTSRPEAAAGRKAKHRGSAAAACPGQPGCGSGTRPPRSRAAPGRVRRALASARPSSTRAG